MGIRAIAVREICRTPGSGEADHSATDVHALIRVGRVGPASSDADADQKEAGGFGPLPEREMRYRAMAP